MIIPHITEVYKCENCKKEFKLIDINKDWKCPECNTPISIKVKIGNEVFNCQRLNPQEIKAGYSMILDGSHYYHKIKNVIECGNFYRIALEEYTAINVNCDDFKLVIMGAWTD